MLNRERINPSTKLLHIPQNLQHTLRSLFFGINPVYQFAIFIVPYNYMFG